MTSKRTVVVAVAVAVGVVASVLSYVFLNNAQNNAYHNAKLVYAYVITKPIPRTLSGVDAANGGYLQQKKVPAEFRPASAVTNLSAIRDEAADANLPAGEIVVSGMFVSPDTIASVAAETVPDGDVAISVSVDQVHGVAGLIQPGDKVDILLDLNGNQETYLYQAVPVLAVGTTLVPAPGSELQRHPDTTATPRATDHLRRHARRGRPHRPGRQRRRWRDRGHLPRPRGRRQHADRTHHHHQLEPHPGEHRGLGHGHGLGANHHGHDRRQLEAHLLEHDERGTE